MLSRGLAPCNKYLKLVLQACFLDLNITYASSLPTSASSIPCSCAAGIIGSCVNHRSVKNREKTFCEFSNFVQSQMKISSVFCRLSPHKFFVKVGKHRAFGAVQNVMQIPFWQKWPTNNSKFSVRNLENWFLPKFDERKITAFENTCYRKSLSVPWTQHQTIKPSRLAWRAPCRLASSLAKKRLLVANVKG